MTKSASRAAALAVGLLIASASGADEASSGWRAFLVGGLTKGGDRMFNLHIVDANGKEKGVQHIYAGDLVQLGVGALWTAENLPVAVGLSVNYHFDDTSGADGAAQFKRVPLEAIGYYVSEDRQWRAGLGVRYVTRVSFEANFPDSETWRRRSSSYEDTKGLVAETGWAFGNSVWMNFRVVKELYQEKSAVVDGVYFDRSGTQKINGSHVGVNLVYAF